MKRLSKPQPAYNLNRLLAILLLAISVSTVGIVSGTSDTARSQSVVIIKGEDNPNKISDHSAYILLFRLISAYQEQTERNRVQAYLKQRVGLDDSDASALIALAGTFHKEVQPLDIQVEQLKAGYHPNHIAYPTFEEKERLHNLQKQKESVVSGLIASLPYALSADGLVKVRQHITERVKRRTTVFLNQANQ